MTLSVDGATLDVLAEGRGPALVLLHAFPLDKQIWDAQASALSATARVVRLDFRGLGRSTAPRGPVLVDTLASDVAAALDALGIERAVIAGHSLGAYVALAFVRLFAERVAGIGLVCGRADADHPTLRERRLALAADVERDGIAPLREFYLPRLFAPSTYERRPELVATVAAIFDATDPQAAAALLRGIAWRASSEDILADIAVPVRVVAGADDALIPVALGRVLADAIPGAAFDEVAAGHMAPVEAPQLVTRSLERLLAAAAEG